MKMVTAAYAAIKREIRNRRRKEEALHKNERKFLTRLNRLNLLAYTLKVKEDRLRDQESVLESYKMRLQAYTNFTCENCGKDAALFSEQEIYHNLDQEKNAYWYRLAELENDYMNFLRRKREISKEKQLVKEFWTDSIEERFFGISEQGLKDKLEIVRNLIREEMELGHNIPLSLKMKDRFSYSDKNEIQTYIRNFLKI